MKTYYKNFDVMDSFEEWDERTQELIKKRLASGEKINFFTKEETEILISVLKILLAEENEDLIKRVAAYIGDNLEKNVGKGYRDAALPKEEALYRKGIAAIKDTSKSIYPGQNFIDLDDEQKTRVIEEIRQGKPPGDYWQKAQIDSKKFFKIILTDAVSSFYSQPEVWSEIGYAGPAYPRDYVRVELGGRDPWEAVADGK